MKQPLTLFSDRRLGLGCATFGGSDSKKVALQALNIAYESGVNYFDVARSYGYGQAESIVGKFIAGKRDKVILSTKFGIAPPRPFPFMATIKDGIRQLRRLVPGLTNHMIRQYSIRQVSRPAVTAEMVAASLEESLRQLKTAYVDYYMMHDLAYANVAKDEVCYQLEKEKEKGKIRHWGATCENRAELPAYFDPESPVEVVQFPYRTYSRRYLRESCGGTKCKIIFSSMGQSREQAEPSRAFFEKLPVNCRCPGLVENLNEAWLYLASHELDSGVILCGMKQPRHIERNVKIVQAPSLPAIQLLAMKKTLLAEPYPAEMLEKG